MCVGEGVDPRGDPWDPGGTSDVAGVALGGGATTLEQKDVDPTVPRETAVVDINTLVVLTSATSYPAADPPAVLGTKPVF